MAQVDQNARLSQELSGMHPAKLLAVWVMALIAGAATAWRRPA
jgi:hypothetical protein